MNLDRLLNTSLSPLNQPHKKQMQFRLPDEPITDTMINPKAPDKPKGYLYVGEIIKTNDELKAERNGRLLKEDA